MYTSQDAQTFEVLLWSKQEQSNLLLQECDSIPPKANTYNLLSPGIVSMTILEEETAREAPEEINDK